MDAHARLAEKVSKELDEVLATLQLVHGDPALQQRLYDQLVDLLVEQSFLGLRQRYLARTLGRDDYVAQLADLADRCRGAGLLPLPSREG